MRLDEHPFFALFGTQVREEIIAAARIVDFPAGHVIFRENDAPDSVYLVLEGQVAIVKELPGGASQTIAVVGAGDYFGEYGVLDGRARSAGAVASGPVTVARLARGPIINLLNTAPGESILGLARHLINNLRASNDRYVQDVVRKTKTASLGEMLNTILHDLRNPLTVIRMAASAIPKLHEDDTTQQFCTLIDDQIERMKIMTDEIMEYARGTAKINLQPVRVNELLERFESLNRDYLSQTHVELVVNKVNTLLEVDVNKILRVLQNLVNNAAEMFGANGGRIVIAARNVSGGVEISVQDNGPGIPDAIRARLFEPFATHGKEKGIGLGLAITKTLVEAHKGRIRVDTEAGKGTTFHLFFPLPVR